jgi:ribose transport system permease protein
MSITAIVAFGMTYVLLLGDVDLSAGSVIALVGTVAAVAVNSGMPLIVTLALAMVAAALLGAAAMSKVANTTWPR